MDGESSQDGLSSKWRSATVSRSIAERLPFAHARRPLAGRLDRARIDRRGRRRGLQLERELRADLRPVR